MHVQPTGVAKCGFGARHVALFRVKPTQGDGRSIMPPVVARKSFNQGDGSIRSLGLAKDVGFEPDNLPDARIIVTCFFRDGQCFRVVLFAMMGRARD